MSTEDNKALMRRRHDEMNRHNAGACDTLLTDDYVEHNNMSPEPLNKAAARGLMASLFAAIPDMHRDIVEQIAEGDRMMERLRYTGTQEGEFRGIPATGRAMSFDAVTVTCLRDGKIVEIWALLDAMTMMQQRGVIPAPAGAG